MNRDDFIMKHHDAIVGIYEAGGKQDSTALCCDKLISSIRGHAGETYKDGKGEHKFDIYSGIPEGFNFEEAYADYKEMTKVK